MIAAIITFLLVLLGGHIMYRQGYKDAEKKFLKAEANQ